MWSGQHSFQKILKNLGVNISYNIDEVMDWADAINVLRIQMERMGVGLFPSTREYRNLVWNYP